MTKEELARMLCNIAETAHMKKRHIQFIDADLWPDKSDEKNFIIVACHSAGAKLVKGKIVLKGKYIASCGDKLPTDTEPVAVIEYNGHWPWDFCYLYRV